MRGRAAIAVIILSVILIGSAASANGSSNKGLLTKNQIISSESLGYDLQYRVYLPVGYEAMSDLPVLYLADGQWYIEAGRLPRLLDKMIESNKIDPVIAVFLDNRDPGDLSDNRRNQQFFCNRDFIKFVGDELTNDIDGKYPTLASREARTILGLSFGGLNSACFGLHGYEAFRGIAMQSPAMHPVPNLLSEYQDGPKRDLKIFLTTGTDDDNEERARQLKQILEEKGYELFYREVPFGHNWDNWRPLLKHAMKYYFASETDDSESTAVSAH